MLETRNLPTVVSTWKRHTPRICALFVNTQMTHLGAAISNLESLESVSFAGVRFTELPPCTVLLAEACNAPSTEAPTFETISDVNGLFFVCLCIHLKPRENITSRYTPQDGCAHVDLFLWPRATWSRTHLPCCDVPPNISSLNSAPLRYPCFWRQRSRRCSRDCFGRTVGSGTEGYGGRSSTRKCG